MSGGTVRSSISGKYVGLVCVYACLLTGGSVCGCMWERRAGSCVMRAIQMQWLP